MNLDFNKIMSTRTIQLDATACGGYAVFLQMVVKPGSASKYKVMSDINGLLEIRINTLDIYAAVEVYGDCAEVIEGMEAEMAEKKANTPDPFAVKPTAKSPISFKGNFADRPISIGRRR